MPESDYVGQWVGQKPIYGARTMVAYSYKDPIDGKIIATHQIRGHKQSMCPRVALLSALIRAMGV
jgi:hypothetical protein